MNSLPSRRAALSAVADYAWMERSIFIAAGARFPDYVQFSVYEVI